MIFFSADATLYLYLFWLLRCGNCTLTVLPPWKRLFKVAVESVTLQVCDPLSTTNTVDFVRCTHTNANIQDLTTKFGLHITQPVKFAPAASWLAHVTHSYMHVSPDVVRLICNAVIILSCNNFHGMAAAIQVAA